jgi:hypothetical protein
MTTNIPTSAGLGMMAATPAIGGTGQHRNSSGTWFEALSDAWGQTLDTEASKIQTMSDNLGNQGSDNPSQITQLTAESLRMGFMSQSSQSSIDSVGKALETMARKS